MGVEFARLLRAAVLLGALCAPVAADARETFPVPVALVDEVDFWTRIYSEVPAAEGLVHDDRHLAVVYERIAVPPRESAEARRAAIDAARTRHAERLRRLADVGFVARDAEDERLLRLWHRHGGTAQLRGAADRVRFQSGMADRFRAGLERSGAWKPWIESTLTAHGLPRELAVLPHVESSFDPAARSRVGAAGLWQFMPATGRGYLRIDADVDERLDPMRATEAAARYLAGAHARLGSWPLAVVSYNHGVNGMARARAQLGSDDIVRVIREYRSPTFGFASRNFYPSFLAALRVEREAERRFPGLVRAAPWRTCTAPLRQPTPVDALGREFGIGAAELRALNPALAGAIWSGARPAPAGYRVRLPAGAATALAARFADWDGVRPEGPATPAVHTVAPGETLRRIAARHGTTPARLAELNRLPDPDRVRVGQVLSLGVDAPAACGPARATAGGGTPG